MNKFNCLCCGDCCSGDMDIKINLYDLYKLGNFFETKSTKELFDKNLIYMSPGQNGVIIPTIRFKKSPYSFCPFLINDLNEKMELKGFCSLHPYKKPLVCIMAPISKIYDTETKTIKYLFTKPTENCPGTQDTEEFTVDTLLKPVENELIYDNEFYDILDLILKNNIKNYTEILYFFNNNIPFNEVIKSIKKGLKLN